MQSTGMFVRFMRDDRCWFQASVYLYTDRNGEMIQLDGRADFSNGLKLNHQFRGCAEVLVALLLGFGMFLVFCN